jgi:integrase
VEVRVLSAAPVHATFPSKSNDLRKILALFGDTKGDTILHYFRSDGCFAVSVRYLTTDRNGVFWFYRRIPKKAKVELCFSSNFVRISLSTREPSEAIRKLTKINADLETKWSATFSKEAKPTVETPNWESIVFDRPNRPNPTSEAPSSADEAATPSLSEALSFYLSQHPEGRDRRFAGNTNLAIAKVIEAVGDLRLVAFNRRHANEVRDFMLATGLKTTSVRRRLDTISSVFKSAVDEFGLGIGNPFSGVRIMALGHDSLKRDEFTLDELKILVNACHQLGDDRRCIIAMLVDTGARLGEIVGLRVSDVMLSHAIPHITIRPYRGRSLKTASSERGVPLVGEALWAAKKAIVGKAVDGLLFPSYGPTKANSASAALNKWVREHLEIYKTMHGLRHTMRTRLRIAKVPEDIQNRIGGWTDGESVSRGYGSYPLEVVREQLERVVINDV